jgi:hypothetical protein
MHQRRTYSTMAKRKRTKVKNIQSATQNIKDWATLHKIIGDELLYDYDFWLLVVDDRLVDIIRLIQKILPDIKSLISCISHTWFYKYHFVTPSLSINTCWVPDVLPYVIKNLWKITARKGHGGERNTFEFIPY